jgi:hypothetical protein
LQCNSKNFLFVAKKYLETNQTRRVYQAHRVYRFDPDCFVLRAPLLISSTSAQAVRMCASVVGPRCSATIDSACIAAGSAACRRHIFTGAAHKPQNSGAAFGISPQGSQSWV